MKNKTLIISVLIISVAVLLLIAAAVWQWNNVQAVWTFLTRDAEQVGELLREREDAISDMLKSIEQSENDPDDSGTVQPESPAQPAEAPQAAVDHSAQRARINEIISEIYALRDSYTAELDDMRYTASYEFWASGVITMENKRSVAVSYIDKATGMEKACDARMKALLSELKPLLAAVGEKTETVDDISYLYAQEKQLKKAQLMEILNADPHRSS